jgi:hypothetical protein
MRLKITVISVAVLGAMLMPLLGAAPAQAQATRTWVSGVGDDVNPCSRTAPCKTFAGAISKTAADGEIDCLDPGGFGVVTITKSITIDCHEVFGSVLSSGTNGININSDNTTAKNVRLRNINFLGAGPTLGVNGIQINGANTSNTSVWIEDCLIDDYSNRGISDARTGGGKLYVTNTTIQNVAAAAISLAGSSAVQVSVDGSRLLGSGFGVAAGPNANVMIKRTTISGNTVGVDDEGGSINIDDSVISGGTTGINQVSGTIRLSNTDVAFNTTAVAGTISSFSNNRFTGTIGGTISPVGQQ